MAFRMSKAFNWEILNGLQEWITTTHAKTTNATNVTQMKMNMDLDPQREHTEACIAALVEFLQNTTLKELCISSVPVPPAFTAAIAEALREGRIQEHLGLGFANSDEMEDHNIIMLFCLRVTVYPNISSGEVMAVTQRSHSPILKVALTGC